jgi:hypothetical protein
VSGPGRDNTSLILGALEDAAAFRRQARDWCDDCGKQPEGQECAEHASDGATARAYDELAERLEARVRERQATLPATADRDAGS